MGEKLTRLPCLTILPRLGEIQQTPTDRGHIVTPNRHTEIWQSTITRENNAPGLRVVDGAGDLAPVRRDDGWVDDHEARACVRDRDPRATGDGLRRGITDRDLRAGEFPEAVARVDGNGGKLPGELGRVDRAELVATGRAVFEIRGEDGLREERGDVAKEGLLLVGADSVEFGESEADKAIGGGVGDEGAGDLGGEANGL